MNDARRKHFVLTTASEIPEDIATPSSSPPWKPLDLGSIGFRGLGV